MPSGVEISSECITAYKDLLYKRGASKPTFVIYRIAADERSIIADVCCSEKNYGAFLQRLTSEPEPRYAVYDVEYNLHEDGQRATTVFISWMPSSTSTRSRMLYASTKEQLRRALDVKVSIHADDPHELEWTNVLSAACGGRL
ncbi:hypothetical protein BDV09DRAFT_200718 [Aspergillus tetrazonus]